MFETLTLRTVSAIGRHSPNIRMAETIRFETIRFKRGHFLKRVLLPKEFIKILSAP